MNPKLAKVAWKTIYFRMIITFVYFVVVCPIPISKQTVSSVKVEAVQETLSNNIVYRYKITNDSSDEIVIIDVGFDFKNYRAELTTRPIEYKLDGLFTNQSGSSPEGWNGRILHQEETGKYYIEWEIQHPTRRGILPGQTLSGFSIILPREDIKCTQGHFDVILRNASRISGRIKAAE